MCGIAGILKVWTPAQRELALRTPHAQSIPEAWLDILDDSIKHRGPDGHGRFRDRALRADGCVVDVALVHRRLSIIDHKDGHQPMVLCIKGAPSASSGAAGHFGASAIGSSSRPIPGRLLSVEELEAHNRRILAEAHAGSATPGTSPELALGAPPETTHDRIAVVFNGCIYNHRELRAELQNAGHVFSTDHSDTEVLVHGWREWRERMFDRLDGMFAIALWDRSTTSWVLARDRAGEKPLFYSDEMGSTGAVAFASTAAALSRLVAHVRGSGPSIDPDLLGHWVRFGFGPGTPSWDVQAVHPRSSLSFECGPPPIGGHVVRWHADPRTSTALASTEPLGAARVEALLADSVRHRLEADVPVGCFLSGGIDSSLIAHFAQQALAELGQCLNTYSVRMPDPRYDESHASELVGRSLGVKHTTLDCEAAPAEQLLALIDQMGVPFGDSSLLPTHWVSRAARQRVKVSLSGDGGDELFCGYERHVADRWLRRHRRLIAAIPSSVLSGRRPKSASSKLLRLVRAARSGGYPELLAIFPSDDLSALGVPMSAAPDYTREGFWFDRNHYLPDDLLRKSDSAAMSVALEVRSPFLSADLIDACFRATQADLMPRGQRKGLLRQVARKYLPAEIVDRPKMGFAIPIGEWFRSDYGGLRTMLLDHLNSTEPFGPPSLGIDLNMAFIRKMLDEHLGTGPSGQIKRDHSQRLYMLLVLSIWAKWMGGLR